MGGPWTKDSSHQDLHDIRLDEDVEAKSQCEVPRPIRLHGAVHEVALVLVAAFIGSSFLVLQRGTVVISDTVRHSLGMDTVATSWITSSSGQAIFIHHTGLHIWLTLFVLPGSPPPSSYSPWRRWRIALPSPLASSFWSQPSLCSPCPWVLPLSPPMVSYSISCSV